MNKIRNSLKNISKDTIYKILSLDNTLSFEDFDVLVLSPVFDEKLFLQAEAVINIAPNIFEIHFNNKKALFCMPGIGADSVGDFFIQLYELWNFKNVIFIGTAGSLCEDIKVNDLVCPSYAVQCNSYFEFMNSNSTSLSSLQRYFSKKDYYNPLCKIVKNCAKNEKIFFEPVYSVDGILTHWVKMDDMITMGCKVVEMEVATLYGLSALYNVNAFSMLFITDNAYIDRSIYDDLKNFNSVKAHKFLMKNILQIMNLNFNDTTAYKNSDVM